MGVKIPDELQFMVNGRAKQKRTDIRSEGKLSVITGTTSGVGKAAAFRFAKGGSDLVMVCRNKLKAEKVRQEISSLYPVSIDIIIADFSDLASVRNAADQILATYRHIDILIHNVGTFLNKKQFTEKGLETIFCVNHLSSFLLNSLLLERMKTSSPSRIIYVNSEGHRFSNVAIDDLSWNRRRYTGLKSYGAAKTAQLLTIWEFADLLEDSNVTINAMHPGAVISDVGKANGSLYNWYTNYILNHFLKDPIISAEALYFLAFDNSMEKVSSLFFNQTIRELPAKHAMDREYGKKVFSLSSRLTDIALAPTTKTKEKPHEI